MLQSICRIVGQEGMSDFGIAGTSDVRTTYAPPIGHATVAALVCGHQWPARATPLGRRSARSGPDGPETTCHIACSPRSA